MTGCRHWLPVRFRGDGHGSRRRVIQASILWPDHAPGHVVGKPRVRFSWPLGIRHLLHLGRISGPALHGRPVSFTVLFAGAVWFFAARLVWTEAGAGARVGDLFARGPDPLGPGWIPVHLLLLSRRLLQGVLG